MNAMIAKPRARVTWTAEERAEWLHLFVESGQSAAEFCRDNGLSPATLSLWRQQIPQVGVMGDSLVEVPRQALEPTAPKSAVGACSVTLPSGLRFDITEGLDMVWFGRLLQAIADAER